MAWRTVALADRRWAVAVAVERRANSPMWTLVLAYRPDNGGRTVWAEYPLQSTSRASLYDQAERLSDVALTTFLEERLAAPRP